MLKDYAGKRDFEKTPEPDPFDTPTGAGPLKFCIQKHAARRLHYDLRLEVDGALVSWAVPKGPSFDPAERRMAVHVEDHPLSYATFEGQIPKGEYGGGEVIVWDEGVYSPDEEGLLWHDRDEAQKQMRDGLKKGKLSVTFIGKKMKGSFALVKMKGEKDWLMLKHKDAFADPERDAQLDDTSVMSGRTIEDVREGRPGKTLFQTASSTPGATLAMMPELLLPMVPTEVPKAFTNEDWMFEIKLDGIRVVAYIRKHKARLTSRNGRDITHKFPRLVEELSTLPDCILDGEIVVFDSNGHPTFQGLMERFQVENQRDITRLDTQIKIDFCIFDMMYLGEWDLRKCSLENRRELLEQLAPASPSVRLMDVYYTEGELLYQEATNLGFEGVVGKKLKSTYQDGKRSTDWCKLKSYQTEEFLVGGFTKGDGGRESTFGALIIGQNNEKNELDFCGTVGGGFSDLQLKQIYDLLQPDIIAKKPFTNTVDLKGSKPTWVEPKHWIEVRYMTRTRENRLRFPIFLRLRPDLNASPTVPVQTRSPEADVKTEVNEIEHVLAQISDEKDEIILEVHGEELKLSSLSRVLWPATEATAAVTKRDLIAYYARMSDHLLRHLRDRPISFVRLPGGLGGERFFQKHWDMNMPSFIETVPIYSSSKDTTKPYVMINNLGTLVWLAQMSAMEIHPWYSRICTDGGAENTGTDTGSSDEALDASALSYPDFMVIDLDPNIRSGQEAEGDEPELNRKGWDMVVEVSKVVHETLEAVGLKGYPKTSGKAGLHIYVPLKRLYPYQDVRLVCETFGRHIEKEAPDKVTMEWSVKKRPEKVFFDHNQNVRGKTLSGPYTLRAVPGAPVSMPIEWKQVSHIYPPDFTIHNVPAIMDSAKDPWAGILEDRQAIPGT